MTRQSVVGAFHAGQRQQVLRQPVHAPGIFLDHRQKLARRLSIGVGVLHQRLYVPLNRSEWCAQLVAHVGNKVAARPLGGFNARYIVQHRQRSA